MRKYLSTFALFFLLSVLVTLHHEAHANYPITNGTDESLPVPANNAVQAKQNSPNAAERGERWWNFAFLYLGWPSGVTIWALVITFAVIAEQTMETRKAAENAGKQLAFQQETLRPRLKITEFITNVFNEAMAGEWVTVNMKISNSGGLPAYGVNADTWIEFILGVPPYRFSSQAKYDRAEHTLNIHSGVPSGFFIPLHRKLTEEEKRIMGQAIGAICFRVRLTYRAFGEEVHTDDAYFVRPDGMEAIGEYSSET
jgi:hypothetical protein